MARPLPEQEAPRSPRRESMTHPLHPIHLTVDELSAYRSAVIACAAPSERHTAERLLGQLASLEAAGRAAERLRFVPAAPSAPLAMRALAHLRAGAR